MQKDEGIGVVEVWQAVASGKGKTQWPLDRRAKRFGELEITFDSMGAAIHARDPIVSEPRAFTGVAHSENLARPAGARDECTAQQPLKIESSVRP